MLSQFATIDEVKAAIEGVKVVSLDKPGKSSTVHWRIGDAKGNQVVLEFVDGVPHFYENRVGVLTNSPDFPWQVTNLNNYVNLYPGAVTPQQWGGVTIFPFGAGAGFHGIPGDVTPPSRFVRVAFYKLDSGNDRIQGIFRTLQIRSKTSFIAYCCAEATVF